MGRNDKQRVRMSIMQGRSLSLCLMAGASVSLVLMLAFNALAGANAAPSIFVGSVSDSSNKYETSITPAGWAFIIWTPIFLWLAVNLIIINTVFFLRREKELLFNNPLVFRNTFLALLMVNFLLNTSWVFIFDRSINHSWLLGLSSAFLILIALTNVAATAVLATNIARHNSQFRRDQDLFVWGVVYRFMLNGFALYTTWTVIASLVNLVQAWNYYDPLINFGEARERMKVSCLVALSFLVVLHTAYFCIENLVFDRIYRYVLTPYLVIIWAASAVYNKKTGAGEVGTNPVGEPIEQLNDFALAIIVIAVITFVLRTILVVARTFKNPI